MMYLKCLHNFLTHSDATQKIKSKRKLNLDFVTWNLNASWFNMFQIQMKIYVSKQAFN
jgi:hypothetical protein